VSGFCRDGEFRFILDFAVPARLLYDLVNAHRHVTIATHPLTCEHEPVCRGHVALIVVCECECHWTPHHRQ